ncbi:MAG: T9SS type A sorting domain-containing protein [Saprospiraceae bacterium]
MTSYFVLLRDYNHDGAMDLFASSKDEGVQGMKVFRGRFENGQLVFDKVEFNNWLFDVLTIPAGNGLTNLYVAEPDYPVVEDLDGDGDLDILSMNSVSANLVSFFKNMAVENGLGPDTLVFKASDYCWGKFLIPSFTDSLLLSCYPDSCAVTCFAGPLEGEDRGGGLHGSSTLAVFDSDGDGDMDFLYGDLLFPKIIFAQNGGNANKAWMTAQDPFFPSYNDPVNLPNFPASFLLDLDNDGRKDYIANPNKAKAAPDRDVWFYKNEGLDENPIFKLLDQKAIVKDMIDLGSGAQPAFFDYDADGLLDMVVGNFSEWTQQNPDGESYLALFRNIGSASDPAFELVNSDWLGFKQFSDVTSAFAPAFGDLDGDGDEDLLVGDRRGLLFYSENIAGPGNPSSWTFPQELWQGIAVGSYATPFIYDLNRDGLPDLLIGERSGNINFLPNIGTPNNPVFHANVDEAPNVPELGGIVAKGLTNLVGYSSPVVLDFGDTVYIATGNESGFIELYLVDFEKLNGDSFEVVDKQFGNLREGYNSHFAFADLNADSLLDAVVGNYRGGLGVFSSPFTISGAVAAKEARQSLDLRLFPVPAGDQLHIQVAQAAFGDMQYQLFDAVGRPLAQGNLTNGQAIVDTALLPAGIYFIKIQAGQRSAVKGFAKK